MFRTHGSGSGTCADSVPDGCALVDIWTHQWKNFNIERKAVIDRSELLPYLYNCSYTSYLNGLGLVLPMYIKYGKYDNSYKCTNQYIFGNSIDTLNYMIIAPITTQSGNCNNPMGGCFNLTQQSIWLPKDTYWYEDHSGKYINGNDTFITKWFDISEIPIYVQSGAIIVRQPFDKNQITGRANKKAYDHLRFDIYPDFGSNIDASENYQGNAWIYEDDGISMDYLNSSASALQSNSVKTTFDYVFNVSNNVFTANIISIGGYDGFPTERLYSVGIRNVFPPKENSVKCNGNGVPFRYLSYGFELSNEKGWYYDSKSIMLIVNCGKYSTTNRLSVTAEFRHNWATDGKLLNGVKGKINRAVLSKFTLDEANVAYGGVRQNLTDVAVYATRLGDLAINFGAFTSMIDNLDGLFIDAISQVNDNVNASSDCSPQRKGYASTLLTTMIM